MMKNKVIHNRRWSLCFILSISLIISLFNLERNFLLWPNSPKPCSSL